MAIRLLNDNDPLFSVIEEAMETVTLSEVAEIAGLALGQILSQAEAPQDMTVGEWGRMLCGGQV
jgi:hypothetical protein